MKVPGRQCGGRALHSEQALWVCWPGAGACTAGMRPGRQPPKAMGAMVGAGQRMVHMPLEGGLAGDRVSKEERCKAGVGRHGESCGMESSGFGRLSVLDQKIRVSGWALGLASLPHSRRAHSPRAQACLPTQRGAGGERTPESPWERPRAWGLGRQSRRDGGVGPAETNHRGPGDACSGEKPLPFRFFPGRHRNEISGLRWGCSAPWRPRCRLLVRGAQWRVRATEGSRAWRRWGRPFPLHSDSFFSGLPRF